jgi:hypothetical protein
MDFRLECARTPTLDHGGTELDFAGRKPTPRLILMLNDERNSSARPQSCLNYRAIVRGALVDIGGSMVMSTVLGAAAIVGMVLRGETPEAIVEELPHSFALVLFVAIAGLVMSTCGGYLAAATAQRAYLRHALLAGMLSTLLNAGALIALGSAAPLWTSAATLFCIMPCAVLGGWLAAPVVVSQAFPVRARR